MGWTDFTKQIGVAGKVKTGRAFSGSFSFRFPRKWKEPSTEAQAQFPTQKEPITVAATESTAVVAASFLS